MKPRIGFLGVGWIGQSRMRALVEDRLVEVAAIADARPEMIQRVRADLPDVPAFDSLDALLDRPLDAVVIATPSALHGAQTIACLRRGLAVFCQKPLARSAAEARRVIEAAQIADRRLGVDMSYRHTAAHQALKRIVADGALGEVHAADLVFHNAYGPDQAWYYVRELAGGGCLMDLGVHLIDQLVWMLGWADLRVVDARLLSRGRPWTAAGDEVEDFAHVVLANPHGGVARVTCSWRASVGCDARIGVELIGTEGGGRVMNVGGSFYDFVAEQWTGTATTVLAAPPDPWGGRAIVEWARAIGHSVRYDPSIEQQIALSATLDHVYASSAVRIDSADAAPALRS